MKLKREACDNWFSLACRLAADWTCRNCGLEFQGRDQAIQLCHIYSRKFNSVRWSTLNQVVMCASCHAYYTDRPVEWRPFLERELGSGHLELLQERQRQIFKVNKQVKADISRHYREEYRRMESTGDRNLVDY